VRSTSQKSRKVAMDWSLQIFRVDTALADTVVKGDCLQLLGVLQAASGYQTNQHHLEAVPVQGSRALTPERMGLGMGREQGFYCREDSIEYFSGRARA
jgi:hypothetical protein